MIPEDKMIHALVCFVSTILVSSITFFAGWWNLLCGSLFSLGLGLGKEYGDSQAQGNKWDWLDILADIIGIILGVLVTYLLFRIGGRR